jgi:biopolymer transport protein ExbD
MPPKTLARVGLVAVLTAILLAWGTSYWIRTRTFEALDVPVTTSEGHLRTTEFRINLNESYSIFIDTDDVPYTEEESCSPRASLLWKWQVFRAEGWRRTTWKEWSTSGDQLGQGPHLGWIDAKPGTYVLDLQFLRGGDCLNARHPRLRVSTPSIQYEQNYILIQYACLFLGGTGAMLVLRALWGWLPGDLAEKQALRIFPEMVVRNVFPLQRHRAMPLMKDFSNFGMIWGWLLFLILAIHMMDGPSASRGLRVDIGEQGAVVGQKSPWTQTLGVYVDGQDRFYVNGQLVPRKKLGSKLQEELGRRMAWTVYFEADKDSMFMDATYAIDTIQGLGAKVVWITPKMREVLNRKNEP